MNRLTAIGLASLVAYGLLIASKYTGIVSAAREEKAPQPVAISDEAAMRALTGALRDEPTVTPVRLAAAMPHPERLHVSPGTLDFRAARDLKAFADGLNARRATSFCLKRKVPVTRADIGPYQFSTLGGRSQDLVLPLE